MRKSKSTVSPILNRFSKFSRVTSMNSGVRDAVSQGYPDKALILFRQMKQNGLEPNKLTFPFIAKACTKLSSLKCSQMVHTHMLKSPYYSDKYVQSGLLNMYVKCDEVENFAYAVFDRMHAREIAAWNAMLMGFVQASCFDRALCLFNEMMVDGVRPDSVTVMGLAQLASGLKDVKLLTSVHCLGIRIGVEADVSVANTWIAAYSRCGDLSLSEMVFNEIDLDVLTVVSWNSMITGCANAGEGFMAMELYHNMLYGGFRPDLSTILNLLGSFAKPNALLLGKLVHSHGVQLGCCSDVSVLNTLVCMYSRCADIDSARSLFDSIVDRTRVSWTVMIGSYAEKGDLEDAMALFHAMEAAGEQPDLVTVIYLISACGQVGALDYGRWIDSYAISRGLKSDIRVSNALLDMYSKCGSARDAEELFSSMNERTIVSWTAMISGYALNGQSGKALDYFNVMLMSGLEPNHITFLAVLQACVHAGLMEKGWELFHRMTELYKLSPGLDHHACMADLLGRQGKLKEALEYIQCMPIKPDAGIWAALLSACKIHRNADIGEYAAHHLFELEPQAAAPYVEMANIYASTGRWDGVASIRTKMKSNQVRKYPGESTIQVDGKSYTFRVDDKFHPKGCLIYEVLSSLGLYSKKQIDTFRSEEFF
ncbi:pentatricopeptide repeat-containing protein At4g19191, mitochondrial-like [Coffea arabica]|uniref:Pentatricopeptide repeat-containing protein At4g19191, mitochondrial-like n=1 Tax=Coffea arabica TaxID=13443 RepID=A0A6P6TBD5_COFAR|nr:pentatricopeptide repeat-containing protein At4g19191, mitochondrial-like [Coffea arabica]